MIFAASPLRRGARRAFTCWQDQLAAAERCIAKVYSLRTPSSSGHRGPGETEAIAPVERSSVLVTLRTASCNTITRSCRAHRSTTVLVCYDAPWRPIGERDAGHVLDQIAGRGPRLVALSAHDSTPWTYRSFARRLGDRYRTLRA